MSKYHLINYISKIEIKIIWYFNIFEQFIIIICSKWWLIWIYCLYIFLNISNNNKYNTHNILYGSEYVLNTFHEFDHSAIKNPNYENYLIGNFANKNGDNWKLYNCKHCVCSFYIYVNIYFIFNYIWRFTESQRIVFVWNRTIKWMSVVT